MKDIMFKPDSIKAIVEGRKTQTRQTGGLDKINKESDKWMLSGVFDDNTLFRFDTEDMEQVLLKPRYKVGEVVYIKEAWATEERMDSKPPSYLGEASDVPLWYKFDYIPERYPLLSRVKQGRWRSPLFMPAWAARYHIKITDVRAEKLQEITIRDIEAEGVWTYEDPYKGKGSSISQCRMRFAKLWNSINGKSHPWVSNPFVWVIGFKKI